MFTPKLLQNLLSPFETSFSKPTFRTFQIVVLGAILTIGARTVCNIQRSLSVLAKAHPSTFHRFFSRRRWSLWSLGRILCSILLSSFCPTAVVPLVADDTVIRRKGKSVYGKGCHRDPTRSSHALTVRCWGHKWVVVALRVRLPWAARPWAIPLLAALYLAPKERERLGFVRAKSTNDLLRQLSIVLLRWFPDRQFTLAADGGYACHALSRFVARHSSRMTLVTKFYADANLYDLPTTRNRVGRPALKGESHPSPKEVVASTKRRHHATVPWYGGEERHISFVTDTSHWYRPVH